MQVDASITVDAEVVNLFHAHIAGTKYIGIQSPGLYLSVLREATDLDICLSVRFVGATGYWNTGGRVKLVAVPFVGNLIAIPFVAFGVWYIPAVPSIYLRSYWSPPDVQAQRLLEHFLAVHHDASQLAIGGEGVGESVAGDIYAIRVLLEFHLTYGFL